MNSQELPWPNIPGHVNFSLLQYLIIYTRLGLNGGENITALHCLEAYLASEEEIQQEARRVRRLQIVVDLVTGLIAQSDDLLVDEAAELVAATRNCSLWRFPWMKRS